MKRTPGRGFFVVSTGNTFRKNTAKGNAVFDLDTFYADSVNTYEGNRFGTVDIP